MRRIYLKAVQYQDNGMPLPNSHTEYAIVTQPQSTHHADFADGESVPESNGGPPMCRRLLGASAWDRVAAN